MLITSATGETFVRGPPFFGCKGNPLCPTLYPSMQSAEHRQRSSLLQSPTIKYPSLQARAPRTATSIILSLAASGSTQAHENLNSTCKTKRFERRWENSLGATLCNKCLGFVSSRHPRVNEAKYLPSSTEPLWAFLRWMATASCFCKAVLMRARATPPTEQAHRVNQEIL